MYAWSPHTLTLTHRLQYFGIKVTDYSMDVDDVREADVKEVDGRGSLPGYRSSAKIKNYEIHGHIHLKLF